ncbi:hypothetical protein A3D62_02295 [Candidatus Kaiserbacteria bacterium RIFCSPHIGHO2_02_FULL_49_11]|uniref:Uncharacterized protein n=1 Tax=Candidatus Kaiserbacteria bacterium RIFCSPHIGHO2_02_FULL_49_11 TaxID=1798489 RepID=A0A1F6D1W8_9BACT|nr:MAG: hypothetical protein A3D62_02295 [Candidatus Kaiserbacteria bacterium RIFCSPHIGHO2_02_FULL_49_11]
MEFASLNLQRVFLVIYEFLFEGGVSSGVSRDIILLWDSVKVISTVVTLLLLTGALYSWIRLSQIRKEEQQQYYSTLAKTVQQEVVEEKRNERWEQVLRHANSENPNDWRLAIIEADTILEDIVARAGFPGETLGERLRGIERSDFKTLDEAWEAHKVRNRIAHDGSNYLLNKRDTLHVVDLYRQVFEEFYYI